MKLVKFDEVFVKLKEISNPGHRRLKKKNTFFDDRAGQL
jgi:hypothetical protein